MAYADQEGVPPLSAALSLLWLRVLLVAGASGPLPAALGTTIHGALGRAIKLTACVYPDPLDSPCEGCEHVARCSYPRLLEPRHLHQGASVPPPALLVAPVAPVPRSAGPGNRLTLDICLLAGATNTLPLLLGALTRLVEAGIGPVRIPYAIARIEALDAWGRTAHVLQAGTRLNGTTPPPISMADWYARAAANQQATTPITLQVTGRMRLQREGAVSSVPPSFVDLIRALARRADALARAHAGEQAPFPDPRPWLAAAETVHLEHTQGAWERHRRRSASTGHTMPLDGFVGTLRYAAPPERLAPFLPLLYLGEAIGVGRGCSFGNGRYRVVAGTP